MTYTSVSSKFQIVIPKEIRERVPLKPGQSLMVYEKGGVIHLMPDIPLKRLRGIFKKKGIGKADLRDKSDRPVDL